MPGPCSHSLTYFPSQHRLKICFMNWSGEYFGTDHYIIIIFSFLNIKAAFLYLPPDYYMAYGLLFGYFLHTFLIRSTLSLNSLFRISSKTVFWLPAFLNLKRILFKFLWFFSPSVRSYIFLHLLWNVLKRNRNAKVLNTLGVVIWKK